MSKSLHKLCRSASPTKGLYHIEVKYKAAWSYGFASRMPEVQYESGGNCVQIISIFGAIKFCSLYLVLAWTSLAPPALAYNRRMMKSNVRR